MKIGRSFNRMLVPLGIKIVRTGPSPDPAAEPDAYAQDGLWTIHNHEFMDDPAFIGAYQRGVVAAGEDYRIHWRVHVALWVASRASRLDGDFVECGVSRGFISSAIMEFLDWDSLGKTFYLLDTFSGLDSRFVTEAERRNGALDRNEEKIKSGHYCVDFEQVKANFAEWKNVRIVRGAIPETLDRIDSSKISYLHIDMNCSQPEVDAANYLWERLVPGAIILLDDYAHHGYRSQKLAMDEFARSKGNEVLSLPTGQGLIIRPAST